MIIKTIVPKLGDSMHYLGKPVTNELGVRIGSISEVKDEGDHYELTMDVEKEMDFKSNCDTVSFSIDSKGKGGI